MTDLLPARILETDPQSYHKLPGFSASLAKILIRQSALHAKDAHDCQLERLAEDDDAEDDDAEDDDAEDDEIGEEKQRRFDRGNIDHALILGIGKRIKIVPKEILAKNLSYGTAESKAMRDAARKAGEVPVKEHEMEAHETRAAAMKAAIRAAGHTLDGRSEFAVEWWEPTPHGAVQCRCMMDHVRAINVPELGTLTDVGGPGATIYELKPVASAQPDQCERTADNLGYAIAACAYQRALTALYPRLGGRIEFRFLWVENRRPYALWDPPVLDGLFREIGERQWMRAVRAWGEGLATGRWPGYRTPDRVEMRAPMWRLKAEGYQPEDY